ncbi:hypothetical protein PHSY_001694 [Pseudozyma hubeiensis SY62]|uniref:Uncharacterized protein n=1 Tax=Pseudozyma hubeiensis (strain SY62) TaxID=1305764 RepID=R9P7N2_PSEHS|nr:hypothetical protein PHSY_001694 [Pseudozyma hubeiensis SY62]GAC94125.1 hypothetical protein PHSY_001694 [Pseudozyma hubeiensis SY62]
MQRNVERAYELHGRTPTWDLSPTQARNHGSTAETEETTRPGYSHNRTTAHTVKQAHSSLMQLGLREVSERTNFQQRHHMQGRIDNWRNEVQCICIVPDRHLSSCGAHAVDKQIVAAIVVSSAIMTQAKAKESTGFFSVLLGLGSVDLTGETQPEDPKRSFNESRPPAPQSHSRPPATTRPHQRTTSSFANQSQAPVKPYRSMDRSRGDARGDHAEYFPESTGRKQAETSRERPRADGRPSMTSMRSSHTETSSDAVNGNASKDKNKHEPRVPRKVAFNTPTHSLRREILGKPKHDEARSSSDSSVRPPLPRPSAKPSKSKNTRTAWKAELEERNWNSSTATLQNKEELRPRLGNYRSAKGGSYPLGKTSQADGFQAVRGSGPDRVIISALAPAEAETPLDTRYLPIASTAKQRRSGPTPVSPQLRASQDAGRTKIGPADPDRSRSYRDRQSYSKTDGGPKLAREPRGSHSRVDRTSPRASMPSRPMGPMPDLPTETLLSRNMSRARAGAQNPISSYHTQKTHERNIDRAKTQKA